MADYLSWRLIKTQLETSAALRNDPDLLNKYRIWFKYFLLPLRQVETRWWRVVKWIIPRKLVQHRGRIHLIAITYVRWSCTCDLWSYHTGVIMCIFRWKKLLELMYQVYSLLILWKNANLTIQKTSTSKYNKLARSQCSHFIKHYNLSQIQPHFMNYLILDILSTHFFTHTDSTKHL